VALDESWQRYPEARIRMREQDLAILIKALSKGGVFISGQPRVSLLEDGVYIQFSTNAGTYGKLIALPIDVFIPCEVPREPAEEAPIPEDQPQETP
jgi:hypothetical protein